MDKQQVLDFFEDTRQEILARARTKAREIARMRGEVSIDDIRELVQIPEHIDPRMFGAVFRGEEWERIGFRESRRKENHARPISVFRLKFGAHEK